MDYSRCGWQNRITQCDLIVYSLYTKTVSVQSLVGSFPNTAACVTQERCPAAAFASVSFIFHIVTFIVRSTKGVEHPLAQRLLSSFVSFHNRLHRRPPEAQSRWLLPAQKALCHFNVRKQRLYQTRMVYGTGTWSWARPFISIAEACAEGDVRYRQMIAFSGCYTYITTRVFDISASTAPGSCHTLRKVS